MKNLILIPFIFFAMVAHGQLSPTQKQDLALQNILSNPGFENGRGKWTISGGSSSITTSGANLLSGGGTLSWTPSGAQTITQTVTLPAGLYGRNCMARLGYQGADSTNYTFYVTSGGSTISNTQTLTTSTYKTVVDVSFICPSSGSVVFTLAAGAAASQIHVDDTFMGENYLLSNITQAQQYGAVTSTGVTNCEWSTTSSTYANFSADTDCNTATATGNASAPSTKIPGLTFTSLPPGRYKIEVQGILYSTFNTTSNTCYFTLSDGTNRSGYLLVTRHASTNNNTPYGNTLIAFFNYTTAQSNVTFQVQAVRTGGDGTCAIANNVGTANANTFFEISVERYPLSSETAYTPDMGPGSWSGYHDSTCSWSVTNASFTNFTDDASCALTERTNMNFGTVSTSGSVSPAITFTPKRAGRYLVCANPVIATGTTGVGARLRLWDGTTTIAQSQMNNTSGYGVTVPLCGIYVASNTSAKTLTIQGRSSSGSITINGADDGISWTISSLDNTLPMPNIVNSVVSTYSGQTRVQAAVINCDGASAITQQDGQWISSVGNISAGNCNVTIDSGIFSDTPICTVSPDTTFSTLGFIVTANATNSTTFVVDCEDDASTACTSYDINVICSGKK